jgi:uncharacterized glyoxalase superfamily protein PhnB
MKSVTPVMFVHEVEPCIRFWKERFGFQITAEVPEGPKVGFVILAKDNVQLMYQSWESVKKDVPVLATEETPGSVSLYLVVDDINDIEMKLQDLPKVIPRRETFYGATEIGVRDPAGHLMCFSQHSDH